MTKKVLCIFLAALLLFTLAGCSVVDEMLGSAAFIFQALTGADNAEKQDIIDFVTANREDLLVCIQENDYSVFENHSIIKSIDANTAVVEFSCSGAGAGSGTFYFGFYYTPDNDMTAIWCAPSSVEALTASGEGFEWREENGDNRYYTEKICEYFYYYEAAF